MLSAPEESTVNCPDLNYSSLYAFVKFYSARAARKAKERISGKRLLGHHTTPPTGKLLYHMLTLALQPQHNSRYSESNGQ